MNVHESLRKGQSQSSQNPFDRVQTNYLEQVLELQSQLKNNKILMNMAIHDMRNPTNAIVFGVTETIQMLRN